MAFYAFAGTLAVSFLFKVIGSSVSPAAGSSARSQRWARF